MARVKGAADLLAEAAALIDELCSALVATQTPVEISYAPTLPARSARWSHDYAGWKAWADSPAINMKEGS